jgi:hypothetical protein
MLKTMTAKYRGRCSITGAAINPGDDIVFDTVSRKAWFNEPGDCQVEAAAGPYLAARTRTKPGYISDVYSVAGREYYRNKQGLCIDAPCCGCCTG